MFQDLYQEILLDHYKNPRNKEDLSHSHSPLLENPTCGDSVRVELQWDSQDVLKSLRFDGQGCAISTASASMMSQLLEGKSRKEISHICGHFIAQMRGEEEPALEQWGELEALSGVIQYPARVKCATLAWHAVEQALQKKPIPDAS